MKFVQVFLSLYSVQVIFISALLMTYLAVTATNRTETIHRSVPIAEEESVGVTVADTESLGGKEDIEAVTSQPTATGIILEARAGIETAPLTGQVFSISNAEIVAESSENESGSTAGQLLFDHRARGLNGEDEAMP